MLKKHLKLPYETVLHEKRLHKPNARIEVEVGHGHGVFKHVPKHLLRVEQKQIRVPREHALG